MGSRQLDFSAVVVARRFPVVWGIIVYRDVQANLSCALRPRNRIRFVSKLTVAERAKENRGRNVSDCQ